MSETAVAGIEERLAGGAVLGAEGYVFELERRGYIKAGPYVPEVVLDFPAAVRELHREFLRAGSEVMVALTYYAHREKLRHVGREGDLEAMNRQAVRIARQVAAEGDALVAGNVCNTWAYDPADPATVSVVRAMYAEQLGWAAEEGIDFVISETNDYLGEALIALEVSQELGLPAMVTLAVDAAGPDPRRLRLRGGLPDPGRPWRHDRGTELRPGTAVDAAAGGADPGGGRLRRRRSAGALPHRRGLARRCSHCDRPGGPGLPAGAGAVRVHPLRDGALRPRGARSRGELPGHLLWRRPAPRARHGRGDSAGWFRPASTRRRWNCTPCSGTRSRRTTRHSSGPGTPDRSAPPGAS